MLEKVEVQVPGEAEEDGDFYEPETTVFWKRECDRCGQPAGTTDRRSHNFLKPKVTEGEAVWPTPTHRNRDLCNACTLDLIDWWKVPGFHRPVNLNVVVSVKTPDGVVTSESVICDAPSVDSETMKALLDGVGSTLADSVLGTKADLLSVQPDTAGAGG